MARLHQPRRPAGTTTSGVEAAIIEVDAGLVEAREERHEIVEVEL